MTLFLDCALPEQRAPTTVEMDGWWLEACGRCYGTGQEAEAWWFKGCRSSAWRDWDPICRDCQGARAFVRKPWAVTAQCERGDG